MKRFSLGALVVGLVILAVSFALDNLLPWSVVVAAFGLLWVLESRRGHPWAAHLGLVFFVGLSFYGIIRDYDVQLMLLAALAFLVAWDLEGFSLKMSEIADPKVASAMIWHHLSVLLGVILLSIGLSFIVSLIELELTFWWVLVIAAGGAIAMTRALSEYQNQTD